MKRLLKRLDDFFFPPAGASKWVRILPFAVHGICRALARAGRNGNRPIGYLGHPAIRLALQ